MITPRFSCSQTEKSVVVSIYCPSVRASEVEIHVDETLLTVHINPYFLRLNFSNHLVEDDASSAHYDPASGYLTLTLTKEVKGQNFADLDLLSKLLSPRPSVPSAPKIEVLGGEASTQPVDEDTRADLDSKFKNLSLERQELVEAAQNDWQLPQTVHEELPTLHLTLQKYYGFLDMYSGFFRHVSHTENEVHELGADAEILPAVERRLRRTRHENEKWDEEHYMADYADDSSIQELLLWNHPHVSLAGSHFEFTEDERLTMLRLPRKDYLATPVQTRNLYLTLVTLMFSYAYDARTTQHDPTPESAWSISSLTPAFSALDPPPYGAAAVVAGAMPFTASELAATLIPSYRRALAFPLYRSFKLAEACRADVAHLFSMGRRMVVRCLLEMKHILDHHEVYYIYSKIWVDDFCSWTQSGASDDTLMEMGNKLKTLCIEKDVIGWDLDELEQTVRETAAADRVGASSSIR